MNDIEISRNSIKLPITEIASKIGINKEDLYLYGDYKAKVKVNNINEYGKLILVTAISPTPFGEGKTTVSIGLGDALSSMGEKSIICLREPSMGPVFGMKGGATGGGLSQVVPMEDINLHFTGDLHAITSANNLISAAIDNHIYFGNSLDIQRVLFKRCLDVNDRALRNVTLSNRGESFNITSASEIMALFCLATSLDDLRERLGRIIVGTNSRDEFVYVKDLKLEGSLMALLKDAFNPNLVQTIYNTPAFIHGGPFANIAHGCSSLIATKKALSMADYVITEAGFGAELGAEKFFDIKCRVGGLTPYKVVLVATIKALKYHGGVKKEFIYEENPNALMAGFANLDRHYNNLKKFGVDVIVCLNQYATDTINEIELFNKHCDEKGYPHTTSNAYTLGNEGAFDLASMVMLENQNNFKYLYEESESIPDKIVKVCGGLYGASKINYTEEALQKIAVIEKNGMSHLPICVAKTQYSFSDDKNKVGAPENFEVTVRDINLYLGAGFITVLLGDMVTMPGLSRNPNYESIDVVNGEIVNLS